MGTGSISGVYYPIGKGIAQASKDEGLEIAVVNSEGSVQNLNWLEQGHLQLCLAQSDSVFYAFNGIPPFREKLTRIRAIASLYTEAVHIIIRYPLLIKNIYDFKGKKISLGPPGSGTESNALRIMESSGISRSEFIPLNLSFEEAIKALNENSVDVVFITSGIPSLAVKQILEDHLGYLFELKSDLLSTLIESNPYFSVIGIPPLTYPKQTDDITTIGVSALLVGRDDTNDNATYNLTKAIFENTKVVTEYHRTAQNISIGAAFKGVAIPVAAGARKYYEEKGLYRKQIYAELFHYLLIGCLIGLLAYFIKNHKRVILFFKKREIGRVVVVLIAIWLVDAVTLYYAEHRINENYSNMFLSTWSGLVNLINFGSKEPFTPTGRTISTIMTIMWIAGITWFTGQIAATFVHRKLLGGNKMENIKDHYIIANWNDKGVGIVEQLRSSDVEQRNIIIISESHKALAIQEKYEDVFVLKRSAMDESSFEKVNLRKAVSVIILARDRHADAETILIILSVRKLCCEFQRQVPIIAEIEDPQKVNLAEFAGLEHEGNIEIVSSKNYTQKILAQAAISPGSSKIYDDLLTFDDIGGEIYRSKIPSAFHGKSFDDLIRRSIEFRSQKVYILPIAIEREEKIYVNPTNKDIVHLSDNDYFYAIAEKQSDLSKL